MTLFTTTLPLKVVSRVWDLYFLDGIFILYQTSIAILRLLRKKLLNEDMEGILHILQNVSKCITEDDEEKQRIFVIDFDGDIKASAVTNLREEITAILMVARKQDEVFVRLQSPGGMVNTYGLAASQLTRVKDKPSKNKNLNHRLRLVVWKVKRVQFH